MQDLILAQVANLGVANNVSCGAAAIAGLLSHWLYFIRGQRSMKTFGIVTFHAIALSLLFFKAVSTQGLYQGFVSYAAISGSYFTALYASVGIYRLFLHPLRRFPGPFAARIAKPYIAWLNRDWKLHDRYLEMHMKYGDFVRVGPNDISIVNLDAFSKLHGPQAKATKRNTGFYDALIAKGELNLDAISDNEMHRDRRRVWDQALGTKALERYEEETRSVLRTFLGRIEELEGKPVNTSLYAKLIPFDNMGRVAFSRDFGTVKEGREDRMLDIIETTFKLAARMGQTPWPLVFLGSLPRFGLQREFEDLGVRFVDERIASDTEQSHDMMKYFLDDSRSEKPKTFHNLNIIYADSHAVLIGATDTISCALGYSFYFLARDAELRQRLYEEIAPTHGKTLPGEFAAADLAKLEFLEAFINETLRMHTSAPLNGPRIAPDEGVEVDGTYIPGGVTLVTPLHIYHRSPKYWKQPNDFIPERWTTRPDLILDRRAFVPFHYGRFDCVGKRLAMNVVRMTIAYTLWNYDFGFAPGEDGSSLDGEAKFQLIVKPGRLNCVFKKRTEAGV
ncbi:cytochrome p450 [Colletotrichum karsti]|uniref:Cytochrome p450 n=1 Tax=Colletotrichum karsti TaxID=1095194 RepID=A0A9P6HY72_9PEZI|nr:cytochrome p450 [Colletotrichum karsti]KAF9873728.1 cytochrome p450 [Colletotrichum karsti]